MCYVACYNIITIANPTALWSVYFAEAKIMKMVLRLAPSALSENAALIFAEGLDAIQRRGGRGGKALRPASSFESLRHVIA